MNKKCLFVLLSVCFIGTEWWMASHSVHSINHSELDTLLPEGEHYQEEPLRDEKREAIFKVIFTASCTAVWLILATAMPFYNKATFGAYLRDPGHNPSQALTPTLIEMLGASLLLILLEVVRHRVAVRMGKGKSWIGTVSLMPRKILWMFLPALFYAGVMGTTNTSLQLTNVNLHVILRTSVIVWVVLLSFFFRAERPSWITLICCAGLTAGTILSSVTFGDSFSPGQNATGAILLTLSSSVIQAGMIVSMRIGLTSLGDTISSPLEAVALKMIMASLMLVPIALVLDVGGWERLGNGPASAHAFVACGAIITAAFAGLQVLLQSLAGAVSIGLLGMCVIVPQVLLSLAIEQHFQVMGYILSPLFASMYAAYRIYAALAGES